ncbi:hypothetical protein SAMN05216283_102668 [Sunxiuqinia elliptica]|uniref:Uncharacterized protein n=1 Tax=Sunxiuqinia elliptica TaxID=655355 RepID=A0A1I2G060_9BACT|nr:hypothetical protein SAMN05216283_102668 [Sunxiuqinia elliptica]
MTFKLGAVKDRIYVLWGDMIRLGLDDKVHVLLKLQSCFIGFGYAAKA